MKRIKKITCDFAICIVGAQSALMIAISDHQKVVVTEPANDIQLSHPSIRKQLEFE